MIAHRQIDWDEIARTESELATLELNERIEVVVKAQHDSYSLRMTPETIRMLGRWWTALGDDLKKQSQQHLPGEVINKIVLEFSSAVSWPAKEIMLFVTNIPGLTDHVTSYMKRHKKDLSKLCQLTNTDGTARLWVQEVNEGGSEKEMLQFLSILINDCWIKHHELVHGAVMELANGYHAFNVTHMVRRMEQELEHHFSTNSRVSWHDLQAMGRRLGSTSNKWTQSNNGPCRIIKKELGENSRNINHPVRKTTYNPR